MYPLGDPRQPGKVQSIKCTGSGTWIRVSFNFTRLALWHSRGKDTVCCDVPFSHFPCCRCHWLSSYWDIIRGQQNPWDSNDRIVSNRWMRLALVSTSHAVFVFWCICILFVLLGAHCTLRVARSNALLKIWLRPKTIGVIYKCCYSPQWKLRLASNSLMSNTTPRSNQCF